MESTEKKQIFYNVWSCAYRRRSMYARTPREQKEHETVLMCLQMKDAKWWSFDSEKTKHLNQ
jgi:hypothetical protein